jgi:hypothetical protein
LQIDTVVSHGDWFNGWGSWGYPSVYRILAEIHRAGVRKVNWRTFFGARAMYHSALEPVLMGDEGIDRPGNESVVRLRYDLKSWDPLKDAVAVSRELALPIVAWYTPYEESHFQTTTSTLALAHPELCQATRDGRRRESKLSFASPKVRSHKVALVEEQLAYGVDGMCLDFFREHHLVHESKKPRVEVDEDGVCIYGYEEPMVNAYKNRFGTDPMTLANNDDTWVQFRNDQTTQFMREVRQVTNRRGVPLSVKVRSMTMTRTGYWWPPEAAATNSYFGSFVDWPTWSKEGLVDEVMVILENWDLIDLDWREVWKETEAARALLGGNTKLTIGFFMNNMHDRAVREGERQLDRCATSAIQAGADAVCLWESTGIHAWGSVRGGGSGTGIGLWPAVRRLTAQG